MSFSYGPVPETPPVCGALITMIPTFEHRPTSDRTKLVQNEELYTAQFYMPKLYHIKYPHPPPWLETYKSVELKSSVLINGCFCPLRNGLQDLCPRSGCLGRPECMNLPVPDCLPSGGQGIRRLCPRKKGYHFEKRILKPDPVKQVLRDCFHKAFMPCYKCGVNERHCQNIRNKLNPPAPVVCRKKSFIEQYDPKRFCHNADIPCKMCEAQRKCCKCIY